MGSGIGEHWQRAAGRIATLSLVGLVVLLPRVAWGTDEPSVNPYEEYGKRIRAAQQVTPLTDTAFGDRVSLYNGATTFRAEDVSLPGNSGLVVAVSRELPIQDQRKMPAGGGALRGFADWSLDVPYVWGTFTAQNGWTLAPGGATNRCSDNVNEPYMQLPYGSGGSVLASVADIWGGNLLHIPGSGDQQMLANTETESPAYPSRSTYKWVTAGNWKIKCTASVSNLAGEGFIAVSPSGVSYTFNYAVTVPTTQLQWQYQSGPGVFVKITTDRINVYLLATRVEDRFGNWVTYSYTGRHLDSITADSSAGNDARSITLNWSTDRVTSVTSALGTWTYEYGTTSFTSKAGITTVSPYLSKVTRPDGSKWTYTINSGSQITNKEDFPYDDIWPPNHCQIMPLPNSGSFEYTIGAPSGASATYWFTYSRHRRTYVPKGCLNNSDPNLHYPLNATDYFDNFYLTKKQISGPGLATATWTYSYHDDPSAYGIGGYFRASVPWIDIAASQPYEPPGTCDTCPVGKVVTVTGPDSITKYTYGTQYARNEGQLLEQDVSDLSGNPLQSTVYTYVTDAQAPGQLFPDIAGFDLRPNYVDPMGNRNRPVINTVIAEDGATFTTTVNSFDAYGRSTKRTESSVMGSSGYSRVTQATYYDDTSLWVLGQVAKSTVAGVVAAQTTYTSQAQPLNSYRFGKLVSTSTWNTDGTLHSITDGRGKVTTLSSWYRGLPRTVTFADGRTERAAINSAGWITSVTDEKGYVTSYDYDAMGRLASITYPTDDDVAWNNTLLSFTPTGAGQYNTPAGAWVQKVQTGNEVTNTYFDGLWRPLVTERFDSGNKAATLSQTVQRYDAEGREVFKSHPVNNLSDYASANSGFHTYYDGLERVIEVDQNSELGAEPLPTITEYLPGFQTRVTDARGNATVTSYQAYGEPSTDWPDSITGPEGSLTVIMRDPFGKPLSITRTGTAAGSPELTRSFVYDGYQRLCKRIEPETGATAFGYDEAGNLAWSAAGLPLPDAGSCDVDAAFGSGRRVDRTYDDRNRLTSITYADGISTASFGYDLDGALLTQTANNGTNLVTTSYTYDRRRLLIAETVSLPGPSIYSIGYGYDANGHLASNTWPDGRAIAYSPNALGQPTRAGSYATGATYYPNGALASFTYGNGLVHTMTQNTRQLPDRSRDSYDGVAVHDDGYDYDGVGNVQAITDYIEAPWDRDMTYDGLNRLTQTVSPWFGGDNIALYSYDVLDNLRSARVGNRGAFNYGYDLATNLLVKLTDPASGTVLTSYAYDVQGNLARKDAQAYQFDQANRLRDVPGVASYLYDAAGRRVRKNETISGRVLDTVYSRSGHLMYQGEGATQIATDYVYLGDSLVARVEHNYIETPTLSGPSTSASGTFTLTGRRYRVRPATS